MGVPISNVTRRVVYAASGTGPYAFTFEILAAGDIAVYKDNTLLTLTTDYTVTINVNGTGSVTLTASPTGATQIAIVGNRTIARLTDFTTGGDFFANTLNNELDQQTIFAQQNAEGLARALQAPQTDPTTINMTLPKKADRANKYLAFDANGNPKPGDTAVEVSTVSSIANEIVAVSNISSAVVTNASNITAIQNASSNASAANTAKLAAQSAQTAAESARDATLAAYDSFDDRYLGTKASDPTLDNDGNALVAGSLYFNTTSNGMKVYTGSAWVAAYVSGSGYLTASNNLSDVSSASSARTNLGLGTAATMTGPSGTIVGTTDIQTLTNKTLTGAKDTVYAISDGAAFEIDPANGSIQTITLGAGRTPKATNFASGHCVLLGIDDGTAYSITWTDSTLNPTWVKAGGSATAPTLATTGYTWVLLWKVSTTIYGTLVGSP